MTSNQILILLHHIILVVGVYFYGFDIYWAVGLAFMSIVWASVVGRQIMHYHFAHSKYKDNYINYFLTFVVLFTGLGSVLSFVASHRQHHAYADTDKDPHSPSHIGKLNVYLLRWKKQKINPKLFRDIASSKFQRFMHKNWIYFQLSTILLLLLIDPVLVCFGVSLFVIVTFHVAGATNVLGHLYGNPRNAPELILTHGSAWKHAEHHGYKIK
jgi:stearoyl-CoA desaturase (delta-9 desaturase)